MNASISDDLYIGVVYRSQNADDSEINELFSVIKCVSTKHVAILGDFNYPRINWITLECEDEVNVL